MDSKDFNHIRETFQKERVFDYEPEGWNEIQQRLQANAPVTTTKGFPVWASLLALLSLLTLASGIYFYQNIQALKQENQILKEKIAIQSNTHSIRNIKEAVIIYDTIYNEVNISEVEADIDHSTNITALQEKITKLEHALTQTEHLLNANTTLFTNNSDPSNLEQQQQNTKTTLAKAIPNTTGLDLQKETSENPLAPLELLAASAPLLTTSNLFPIDQFKPIELSEQQSNRRTFNQLVYLHRPKGFSIGLTSGGYYFLDSKIEQEYPNFDFSAKANIHLNKHFDLWVNAGLQYNKELEIDGMNAYFGVPSTIEAPEENYELEEIKIDAQLVTIFAGLSYRFRPTKKLQPFIQLGYGNSNTRSLIAEYKFEEEDSQGQGQHEDEEQTIIKTFDTTFKQLAMLGGGVNYQLNKHFFLRLNGYYQTQFTRKNEMPNQVGLRLGVFYQWNK